MFLKKLMEKDIQDCNPEKSKFIELTEMLIDLMVEFSVLTLKAFNRRKKTQLTQINIEDIVNFDLQFRIQQIQDPELLDIVRERVTELYME